MQPASIQSGVAVTNSWELFVTFLSATISGAIGAFVAAWILQRYIDKNRKIAELSRDIHLVNVAIYSTSMVANQFFQMKVQFVKSIRANHLANIAEFEKNLAEGLSEPTKIDLNFLTLEVPIPVTSRIEKLVLEDFSEVSRATQLAMQLIVTEAQFLDLIVKRNEMIEHFKSTQDSTGERHRYLESYLGRNSKTGHRADDTSFHDVLVGLSNSNDDGLMFSKLLLDDLVKIGVRKRSELLKLDKKSSVDVVSVELDEMANELPDINQYSSWFR